MQESFVDSAPIRNLLDRAAGLDGDGGDARLKAIMRDLLEATARVIVRHDVTESEFWGAVKYLQDSAGEIGLIVPGIGLEHFMDLYMDAKDAEAGLAGGTPRTIEGPLYVAGAPLVEGPDVNLTVDPDDTAAALAGDHIGLEPVAVVDVDDAHLLALHQVRGVEQIGVDGHRADVVQVGLGDGRAMDLRLQHGS